MDHTQLFIGFYILKLRIHVATCINRCFFSIAEIYSVVYQMYLSIHSPVNRYLCCFHFAATMNKNSVANFDGRKALFEGTFFVIHKDNEL